MGLRLSVVVPFRPSSLERDRNWRWNEQRWRAMLPGAEIVTGEPETPGELGAFDHARAVNRAAERATGDVFLVADADVAVEPLWVKTAVEAIQLRQTWALTHAYHTLSEAATARLVERPPGNALSTSSVVESTCASVAPPLMLFREAFETVGGYDERNVGWSGDDICFFFALATLWGQPTRTLGDAFHLWHPKPLDANYGQPHFPANRELYERYQHAGGADAMRALLSEPGGPLEPKERS